jgi:hypothetical protein
VISDVDPMAPGKKRIRRHQKPGSNAAPASERAAGPRFSDKVSEINTNGLEEIVDERSVSRRSLDHYLDTFSVV